MILIIMILPESPRWLAAHDRSDESLAVLRRLKRDVLEDDLIVQLHEEIIAAVKEQVAMTSGSWRSILRADKIHSRRRLLIACGIQAFQQLGGITAIICPCFALCRLVLFADD